MSFCRRVQVKYLRYGGINLKIISEITLKIKIEEDVTKEDYLKFTKEKSFEERKIEFKEDVIAELKDIFDVGEIEIHEFNCNIEED